MPARLAKTARAENGFELPVTERRRTQRDDFRDEFQEIAVVEPEQPIHANLIEFPRELVAARRARPRLAEGPLGASAEQLSIFEVDPGAICTEPDSTKSVTAASSRLPEWSGMELEAQPIAETEIEAEPASALALARISRRLMAAVVDGALIVGGCLAATLVAIAGMKTPIAAREAELAAIVALAALGALYQAFFFTLGKATPGMKYAGISLCTFNDEQPTRARLFARLGALPLSLAPLGLGVLWILFDEDRLSWHDRISRTYQREC
jgi:uncharacterized RDD family membrane protein YckC